MSIMGKMWYMCCQTKGRTLAMIQRMSTAFLMLRDNIWKDL